MPVVRWIKYLGSGAYEFWYDNNTKSLEQVDPVSLEIIRKASQKFWMASNEV